MPLFPVCCSASHWSFSVGPVIFTIIKLRINYGVSSAFYFISGVWLSDLLWVFTANLLAISLGTLIEYKNMIGLLGGSFLIGLGAYYLFFKKNTTARKKWMGHKDRRNNPRQTIHNRVPDQYIKSGVIALWFAAATKSLSNAKNERITIFSLCLSMNILADIAKIINLAGKLRKKLTYRNIRIINKVSGLLFPGFGVALLIGVMVTMEKQ